MKKTMIGLLLLILLITSSGCSYFRNLFEVKVVACENSITLTCEEDIIPYLPYDNYPTYTLTFDGTLNITENRQGNYECIFTQNDDFFVSNVIRDLLEEYSQKERLSIITISTENSAETWMNRRDLDIDEKVYLKVKNNQIFNQIAYITLENGLQLTINYATFTDSDNITYYRWETTQSIRIVLQYPMMITKIDDQKRILFLALPNAVHLSFDTVSKKLDRLISDDKFMDEEYYTYQYPNGYESDYNDFYQYYVDNFNGREINGDFIHTFLGYDYKIVFTEDNFVISLYQNLN